MPKMAYSSNQVVMRMGRKSAELMALGLRNLIHDAELEGLRIRASVRELSDYLDQVSGTGLYAEREEGADV